MEKWNSIKRKKYGYLYVVLKAVCFGMLNILCYRMLSILGFLQVFQKDFIPYITTTEGIASVGLILICIAIYSRKGISYLGLNLIIKHYKYVICILAFVIGIFAWQRCDERLIAGVLFCEEVFLVGFIEIESNRIFPYEFRDEYQGEVFYTEKPVFKRSMLTKAQENALIQILKILDNRSSFDSIEHCFNRCMGKRKDKRNERINFRVANSRYSRSRIFCFKNQYADNSRYFKHPRLCTRIYLFAVQTIRNCIFSREDKCSVPYSNDGYVRASRNKIYYECF